MTPHRLTAALLAASLTACGTTSPEPVIRTVEVLVPTPVSCVPAGARIEPEFRISRELVAAATDAAERLRLVAAGFLERDAFIAEVLPVLRGCKD